MVPQTLTELVHGIPLQIIIHNRYNTNKIIWYYNLNTISFNHILYIEIILSMEQVI